MNNFIMVTFPYKTGGIWMFDDAAVGLVREPFVDRVNYFIDTLTANIPDTENRIRLLFSEKPFPGWALSFKKNQRKGRKRRV